MSKYRRITIIILLVSLLIPFSAASANNGVDDLRGRWDIHWQLDSEGEGALPELEVLVTEIEESTFEENVFLATGCMAIAEIGEYAPLILRAKDNLDGTYDVIFLSTLVPGLNEEGPFVVRFDGFLEVHGSGVNDDTVSGEVITAFSRGAWSGEHHDRRRVKCPTSDSSVLFFEPDLYMERDRAAHPHPDYSILGGSTNIVSTAMQVDLPDGRVIIADFAFDIFTTADFVSEFAFDANLEETPIIGEPYTFTLLDALGRPIPGTETQDYWFGCPQDAPRDLEVFYAFEDHINLSWTSVPDVSDQFEPLSDPQIGFYQIETWPLDGGEMIYGMNVGSSSYHNIPWHPFTPDDIEDDPDGYDRGISFSEFEDGLYDMRVLAFSDTNPDQPGFGFACQTEYSDEHLVIEKIGNDLNFFQFGSISGRVTDESGYPIEGIFVTACEYDNEEEPYCRDGETDSNGEYAIASLMPDMDYRVFIHGQPGWVNEFYDDTIFHEDAARVGLLSGEETPGINFALVPGGSISGTVFDFEGTPLAGIAVDTEFGGYGTCTDENGFYSLEGVPVGAHNVVAGREFCDEHPYAEQMIEGVETGATGIDFYLEIGTEPSPQYLNVQPDHKWADSGGWQEGAEVKLSFDSYEFFQIANADGNVWFEDLSGTGIGPDTIVTVTDGTDFKELEVVLVTFDGIDDVANTAWGTVLADGGEIAVGIEDENGSFFWVDGVPIVGTDWLIDFDDYGQDFGVATGAWVHIFDEDGDSTLAHLDIEPPPDPPFLNVQPDHGWAHSGNWQEGVEVTLSFTGYLSSQFADAEGMVYYDDLYDYVIGPGTVVNITDGTQSKDLLIVSISFAGADDVENTAWGTGPAEAWIGVGIHDENGGFFWVDGVQVDTNGNWFAEFDDMTQDFGTVTVAWVHVFDDDGDSTIAHLEISEP